jgi:hypothetical protein
MAVLTVCMVIFGLYPGPVLDIIVPVFENMSVFMGVLF